MGKLFKILSVLFSILVSLFRYGLIIYYKEGGDGYITFYIGWVWVFVLYYMQDLSDFRGHEDQLYNKSVSPGAAMFKAREPVFPCTANSP